MNELSRVWGSISYSSVQFRFIWFVSLEDPLSLHCTALHCTALTIFTADALSSKWYSLVSSIDILALLLAKDWLRSAADELRLRLIVLSSVSRTELSWAVLGCGCQVAVRYQELSGHTARRDSGGMRCDNSSLTHSLTHWPDKPD
jgi:hypothetical protein